MINFMHVSSSYASFMQRYMFRQLCSAVSSRDISENKNEKLQQLQFFLATVVSPYKWQSTSSHFNLSLTWVDDKNTESEQHVRHTQDLFKCCEKKHCNLSGITIVESLAEQTTE